MKLTKKSIDTAEYEGTGTSRHVLWDDALAGFGVRVYPTGRKSFVLSYRNADRRKRLMTLGQYGVMTLTQARQLARERLVDILRGEDPVGARREVSASLTLEQLLDAFTEHAREHFKTWKEGERYFRVDVIPRWGHLKAHAFGRGDAAELHHSKRAAPYAANRCVGWLRSAYNWAPGAGLLPLDHPNPMIHVKRYPERKRERFVSVEEMPRLALSVSRITNHRVIGAVWLHLFTALRKSELLRIQWEHIDIGRRELLIPDTKNGRPHRVPLSDAAILVFQGIPRRLGNPYVFWSTHGEGRHLTKIDHHWQKARAEAGLEDVRVHDLRRTVASWIATSGTSLIIIGKMLNHKSLASTEVYARLHQDPVRKELDAHSRQLLQVLDGGGGLMAK